MNIMEMLVKYPIQLKQLCLKNFLNLLIPTRNQMDDQQPYNIFSSKILYNSNAKKRMWLIMTND